MNSSQFWRLPMPMELRWIANRTVSCFHAAWAVAQRLPAAQPVLLETLTPAVKNLTDSLEANYVPQDRFFEHLVPLSCGIESSRDLAEATLRKFMNREQAQPLALRLAGDLTAIKKAYDATLPDLLDQLELRSRPLREQWEARGPGMLAGVGRRTEPDLLVEKADVILVDPFSGGGGESHLPYNSVRIEAVLANPCPQLPEVVRLAWLLSMLNLDLPLYSEKLPRERAGWILRLAMLPAVVAAAVDVELAQEEGEVLKLAIKNWNLTPSSMRDPGETLTAWWQTFVKSRPAWPVALVALDKMLAEPPTTPNPSSEP
jgi:hypothetical protein